MDNNFGTPSWVRTSDLRLRSPLLYPAELSGRMCKSYRYHAAYTISWIEQSLRISIAQGCPAELSGRMCRSYRYHAAYVVGWTGVVLKNYLTAIQLAYGGSYNSILGYFTLAKCITLH